MLMLKEATCCPITSRLSRGGLTFRNCSNAMEGKPLPKFVSPSRIARYYFQECARYLRYSSTPKSQREEEGVPAAPHDFRPVSNAILETGYLWEEQVIDEHLADTVTIAAAEDGVPVRERVHSSDQTRDLLEKSQPGDWIYQGTLVTPNTFYERYGLDRSVVQFTECRPDLIECFETDEGDTRLRVTDVKASTGLKLSHRIQATMYSLILDSVLQDAGIDGPGRGRERRGVALTGP